MPTRLARRPATAVLPLATALLLTACGAQGGAGSDETAPKGAAKGARINLGPQQHRVRAHKVASIAALLPSRVRKRGTLEVANSAGSAPPLTFYANDDKTVIGVEPDIASLVADVLGLKLRTHTVDWANIFVGLDSGKYDAGFSNITDTEERKEKYDFATYRLDDIAFETKKGSALKIRGPKDVAGKTIGVGSGTNQEKLLVSWSKANVRHGLKATRIKYFQKPTDYYLALSSGRLDAYLGPSPVANYHTATAGQTEVAGTYSGGGSKIQGRISATTKKDDGLVKPLNKALNTVIRNGTYGKVLRRWGLSDEAVKTSQINPRGLPRTDS